jgi:RimJ/RimL family protein N-acetyltransferase
MARIIRGGSGAFGMMRRVELSVPTIATERLVLRPFREDDAAALFEISQDPDVMRFIGIRGIPTAEDCWRSVAGWIGHWVLRGYGQWAVEERSSGRFIGRLGVINPVNWPGPEIGYMLGKPWWHRGYATEGARAAMDWAFTQIGFEELISIIDPANTASIGVATRLGETWRGEVELYGMRLRRYAITRTEWEARRAAP